nr:FMN-binding protein [Rhodococcus sp. (in: high G+C Gram-positive bacteria)]
MRKITTWVLTTLSALVLLFSYHTSTSGPTPTVILSSESTAPATTSNVSTESDPSPSASAGTPPPSDTTTTAATPQTVTGTSVSTRFGPVRVQITITDGTITDAAAIDYPTSNGRDQQINARAVPVLEEETIEAGSADIDMVSGATYTSEGYVESLQSAIDQAHLS